MTNYKQFYNSWQSFAKPKKELILEQVAIPVQNSQLEVNRDSEHSFKIKVKSSEFLKLITNEQELALAANRAAEKGQFDPSKVGKVYLRLDNRGVVKEHEGRATNFMNMQANGPEAEIEAEIIIPIHKRLNRLDFPFIRGQRGLADGLEIPFNDLFPATKEELKFDASDPIKIGDNLDIPGYDVDVGFKLHSAGIQNVLIKKYSDSLAFQKIGLLEYVKLLNNAYTVVDNSGRVYKIVFTTGQPDYLDRNEQYPEGKRWETSTNFIHLDPHPYIVYGDNLKAKEKVNSEITFTIKKK